MKVFNFVYRCLGVGLGKNVRLQGFPIIINKGNIIIGSSTTIKSSFLSNLVGLYQRTIIVARTSESVVELGDNVGISGATIYARDKIVIGNNSRIGGNTKILDNDFHPIDPQLRLNASNENMSSKPIYIGENVFIGCNCLILKGVTIGDNSIVGAGSVVTKDVPPNCIVAGNPAKVVKRI